MTERRTGEYHVAVREYKHANVLYFQAFVSVKPLPKVLNRWNDSLIAEVRLVPAIRDGIWDVWKWPYMLKWDTDRQTPVESWQRGLMGFHNISNRIRKVLGFAPSHTEWREPRQEN